MSDLLATMLVLTLLVALACVAVALLGVVPFVRTVDAAEQRGFSPSRWGAAQLLATALMAVMAYVVLTGDHSRVLLLPALGVGLLPLLAVWLTEPSQRRLGGVQGAHER